MKLKSSSQLGAGLIEVLVTALLVSTALLTLVSLQVRSVQYNKSAYFRSQANILAYDILDRIRLNHVNHTSYKIDLNAADPIPSAGGEINAASDIVEWRKAIKNTLPNGQGGISCENVDGTCIITIQWGEVNTSGNTAEDTSKFVFHTRV